MNVSDSAFKSERHGVRGPSSAYAASGCARGWLPRLKARDASGGRTLRGGAGGSCSRWSTSWPCARSGGGGRMRPGVAGGGAASWGQGPPPASCRRLEGCPAAASAAAGSSTSSRRHGLPFLPRVESTPPPTFQVVNAADSLFRLLFFTNPDAPTYITASAQNLSAPASRRCFFPSPPPPRPPPPASVSLSSWSANLDSARFAGASALDVLTATVEAEEAWIAGLAVAAAATVVDAFRGRGGTGAGEGCRFLLVKRPPWRSRGSLSTQVPSPRGVGAWTGGTGCHLGRRAGVGSGSGVRRQRRPRSNVGDRGAAQSSASGWWGGPPRRQHWRRLHSRGSGLPGAIACRRVRRRRRSWALHWALLPLAGSPLRRIRRPLRFS